MQYLLHESCSSFSLLPVLLFLFLQVQLNNIKSEQKENIGEGMLFKIYDGSCLYFGLNEEKWVENVAFVVVLASASMGIFGVARDKELEFMMCF